MIDIGSRLRIQLYNSNSDPLVPVGRPFDAVVIEIREPAPYLYNEWQRLHADQCQRIFNTKRLDEPFPLDMWVWQYEVVSELPELPDL